MIMRRGVLIAAGLAIVLVSGCDKLFDVTYVDPPVADAAQPVTALVQQQTASNANALSLDATLAAPPANGDVLIVIGASDRFYLATPSGGGVTMWMQAAGSAVQSNVEIWYGVSDGSSSTVTIACSCANAGNMRLLVTEWSGIPGTNAVEIGKDTSGTSTNSAASITVSTLDTRELLVFGVSVVGSIGSMATGEGAWSAFTSISIDGVTQSGWYQLVDQPGSYGVSVPVMGDWDAAVAAFRTQP